MAPEPKRRKTNQLPPRRATPSPAAKKDRVTTSMDNVKIPVAQSSGIDLRTQQAKRFAVAQAQQEGCTANFRIFDSLFGNFLVPVIPTRAELEG